LLQKYSRLSRHVVNYPKIGSSSRQRLGEGPQILDNHCQIWRTCEHVAKPGWVLVVEDGDQEKEPQQNTMAFHAYTRAAITNKM